MVSGMTKTAIVGGVGIVVVILSATLGWILVPNLVSSGAVISSENSAIFDAWTVPPVPVYLQFFLFNCTNCDTTRNSSAVFHLEQLGPFTYREERIKYGSNPDGSVVEKDGQLYYRENITYIHEPKEDEMSLDAIVISVNPIYFTLASLIADMVPPDFTDSVSSVMNTLLSSIGETPFMKRSVREMLFEGWSLKPYITLLEQLSDLAGIPLPIPIPEDFNPTFGYYTGRNGTNLGEFKIESGAIGLDQLGMIREWEGTTQLTYWNDEYCDKINGTDGAIYPPLVDVDKPQFIFTPDLCRAIYATYERDYETMGISSKRFTVPEIVFGSPATTPENRCYCRETEDNIDKCFSDGILDMRPCSFQAPILLSTPHFFMGDKKYVDAFTGLKPVKEWHETHFDLEPLTAVPTFASKRIQINIDVRRYNLPTTAFNLKNTVFPVVWINETAKLDEASANDLNKALNLFNGLNISRWTFLAAGIVLVIAGFVMLVVFFPR